VPAEPLAYKYDKFYKLGEMVLDRCFPKPVLYLDVASTEVDWWIGSVRYSTDGGSTFRPMVCAGCTNGAGKLTATLSVEGGSWKADHEPNCNWAKRCRIVPAS